MWTPTKAQVDAGSRHAISIAGTAIVIFGLQAKGITIEQVTSVINSLGGTVNDLVVLAGALAPLYALLRAGKSASPTSQIQSVQTIATGPGGPVAEDAQKALIAATSAVAQDAMIPKSTEAKAALIDAVAAQPEVVGSIRVTDQAVVDATQSPQVQKAT